MCIVSAAVTELGEIKMSAGWCFMSWILDLWSRRIAALQCICGPVVSMGESNCRKPSSNPGRAEPRHPVPVNAALLTLMW